MPTSLNVLSKAITVALSRARPNPLPSNQILTTTTDGQAAATMGSTGSLQLNAQAGLIWGGPTVSTLSNWSTTGEWQ